MSHTVIEANRRVFSLNIKELIDYRELLWMLAYRDIKVRYAQAALGVAWAFLQPALTLLIFTLVFGRVIKVETGNIPYALYALAGMSLWSYFSNVISQAGNSVIGAQDMVKKIYFPRLIIPISKIIAAFVDFLIALLFLVGMMAYYGFMPSANSIASIGFILLTILAGLGVGIWVSALSIRFRDLQYVLPFIVQMGLYATPVAYPPTLVPEQYLWLYYINPMSGIIDGFRWSLFNSPLTNYSIISGVVVLLLCTSGLYYFQKNEGEIADII
jgi:lipopolysaccharide transport system permease protein